MLGPGSSGPGSAGGGFAGGKGAGRGCRGVGGLGGSGIGMGCGGSGSFSDRAGFGGSGTSAAGHRRDVCTAAACGSYGQPKRVVVTALPLSVPRLGKTGAGFLDVE
jgi:hypothetical protein